MNTAKKKTLIFTALFLVAGIIISFFLWFSGSQNPEPQPTATQLSGLFIDKQGVIEAQSNKRIFSGEVKEAVSSNGYLLTSNKEGTLTLTRLSDQTTIPLDDPNHAYQLKVVGDDFGYLKQYGQEQFITFLDPKTGKTGKIETKHNVITWDVSDEDITYHLYDTGIIGFARYNNALDMKDIEEREAGIETIGQMFSSQGKTFVWVVANKTENIVYSLDTRADVTSEFPVISKASTGTISEVVGDYWILTAPVEGSTGLFSQVWDREGTPILNLTMTGYNFGGNAQQGTGVVYVPVSYTNGNTPDGLLIMNAETLDTDYQEGFTGYISDSR